MEEIFYVDRKQGKICKEKVYGLSGLLFLYARGPWWKRILSFFLLPACAYFSWVSRLYGYFQKRKESRKKIAPFIREYEVDVSEFLDPVESFQSFNEFFTRKLKPEARPIDPRQGTLILPADGRYLVFPKIEQSDGFYVKGQPFCLETLLNSSALARRFAGGSMAIARLCPADYHRFHFPCDAIPSRAEKIGGHFYSVNPIALRSRPSIFWENKRFLTELETERFGTILYLEVGAACVASVTQVYLPGSHVKKGEEKGFFSFGGSTLLLLFEKGRISFSKDLAENSAQGLETLGRLGQPLGHV